MSVGIKHDQGKPDYTHIPKQAMDAMGGALTYGAKKYSADNYREGLSVRRQVAAALRHIYQFLDEGNIDSESGCKHIGSALASLAMAAYTVEEMPDYDDRYFIKKARELNEIARLKGRDND